MTKTWRRDEFLYHMTQVEHISSILLDGIQPSGESHRDSLEEELSEIAAEHGFELPFDRRNCVFLYPSLTQAASHLPGQVLEDEKYPFGDSEGVVVVDGTQIESDFFIAEFQFISDAIDLQFMEEPDHAVTSSSYSDALQQYAASVSRVDSLGSLAELCNRYTVPEVVVERGVGPDAIVGVLCDQHPSIGESLSDGD